VYIYNKGRGGRRKNRFEAGEREEKVIASIAAGAVAAMTSLPL